MRIIPVSQKGFHKEHLNRIYGAGWVIMDRLAEVILTHRRECIVEIGMGASTAILAKHAKIAKVKLYSCDNNPRKTGKPLFNGHTIYKGKSFDFIKTFKDTTALVLIDACHAYGVAKLEFDFFFTRLLEGGVIFLHDTAPPTEALLDPKGCHDVYRLRQDLEKRTDLDCFTWPYTALNMGLTMVIKKEKDPPYWRQ